MKKLLLSTAFAAVALLSVSAAHTDGMTTGKASFKSMGPIAFGEEGILFVADSKSAAITALATGDTAKADSSKTIKVENLDKKVAALLGTTPDQVLINDMAVNPASRNVYLAVSRGRGPEAAPVLIRVKTDGSAEAVSTDNIKHSRAELPDAPADAETGEGNRRRNARLESITDIAYLDHRLLVAGLSNEEFASTFRSVPFPFKKVENGTSVEIYHGAHGRFETASPVRTFVPFNIGKEPHLLAAYTCTPLVQFSMKELAPGAKIKGKTIAELGNRNRPLDMIVYHKGGQDYLLLANNSRGIMKIPTEEIERVDTIRDKVADTAGLKYETIKEWTGVDQLDKLDDGHALVLRRNDSGVTLESLALP